MSTDALSGEQFAAFKEHRLDTEDVHRPNIPHAPWLYKGRCTGPGCDWEIEHLSSGSRTQSFKAHQRSVRTKLLKGKP